MAAVMSVLCAIVAVVLAFVSTLCITVLTPPRTVSSQTAGKLTVAAIVSAAGMALFAYLSGRLWKGDI